jgi:hypothetical protein
VSYVIIHGGELSGVARGLGGPLKLTIEHLGETPAPKEVTLSEAVSNGYVALARLAVLANLYLIASVGQAVANKVFKFDKSLFDHPLNTPETAPAIGIYKYAVFTGPRLITEALAQNDVNKFYRVQSTVNNFIKMIFIELPKTVQDNALVRFGSEVVVKSAKEAAMPTLWPW